MFCVSKKILSELSSENSDHDHVTANCGFDRDLALVLFFQPIRSNFMLDDGPSELAI